MRRSTASLLAASLLASIAWSSAASALENPAVYLATFGSYGTGPGQFGLPHGLCADRLGHVYIADAGNHWITELTYDGVFVRQWGSLGSGPGQFSTPWNVFVSHDGFVYVTERDNHRVQKFTSDGQFVLTWGTLGSANGQFYRPYGVVEDAAGKIYVSDFNTLGNGRVQVFTPQGVFIATTTVGNNPCGLAFNGTDIYAVVDGAVARSHGYPAGLFFNTLFNVYTTNCCPYGIAIDPQGNVVVPVTQENRIKKYTPSGSLLADWKTYPMGTQTGSFNLPHGISFDADGNFYVADAINRRVLKFSGTQTAPVPTARTSWGRLKLIYR